MIDRTGEPVVVLTVSGERPEYLEETLASWARVRGLGAWTVGVLLEPGSELARCRKVVAAFDALDVAAETVVVLNPTRLGVRANPHRALSWAFEERGARFAVLGEEDIVVGDDVLEFFAAQASAHADDPGVLALCAFSRLSAPQPVDVVAPGAFSPWVWGTWADRWHGDLATRWFDAAVGPSPGVEEGFDFGIERVLAATGRRVLIPLASRSDNIGREGGVHALPEDFELTRPTTFAPHRAPVRFRGPGSLP